MEIKELVAKYGAGTNVRFTRKQKNKFISILGEEFQEMGYSVRGVVGKYNHHKAVNLTVGNVGNASKLYICNYDTPQRIFSKKEGYYPLDGEKNFTNTFTAGLVPLIVFGIITLYYILYLIPKINMVNSLGYSIVIIASFIIILYMSMKLTLGIANPINFNRNTSSVVTLVHLASTLSEDEKKKVAFVFTDYGSTSHAGDKMVRKALPKTIDSRKVVYLDCVGNGEEFVIGYQDNSQTDAVSFAGCFDKKPKRKKMEIENRKYSSAEYYPSGLVVSRGTIVEGVLSVNDTCTNRDININETALLELSEALKKYTFK